MTSPVSLGDEHLDRAFADAEEALSMLCCPALSGRGPCYAGFCVTEPACQVNAPQGARSGGPRAGWAAQLENAAGLIAQELDPDCTCNQPACTYCGSDPSEGG